MIKKKENIDKAMKKYYKKIGSTLKRWNNIFCTGISCKTNAKRDIVIIIFAIGLSIIALGANWYFSKQTKFENMQKIEAAKKMIQEAVRQDALEKFEEENAGRVLAIQERFDPTTWKEYKSNWYGFKIKYPQDWKYPLVNKVRQGSRADYRVSFLSNRQDKNFIGFDVAVYDINKIKELSATDEFPKIKTEQLKDSEQCKIIEGHIIETGDYPAEEIYIPLADDCYEKTFFFSVVNGQYIYNLAPVLRAGTEFNGDPMIGVSDDLPEFFSAISQFENIEIVRPKPKPKAPAPPKITAPYPVSYKKDSIGRLICAKKNDKPSKSKKNKNKHLDMECCLDPDEYPNPHCYYPVEKYGKYLK